jgi:hypothetical protein
MHQAFLPTQLIFGPQAETSPASNSPILAGQVTVPLRKRRQIGRCQHPVRQALTRKLGERQVDGQVVVDRQHAPQIPDDAALAAGRHVCNESTRQLDQVPDPAEHCAQLDLADLRKSLVMQRGHKIGGGYETDLLRHSFELSNDPVTNGLRFERSAISHLHRLFTHPGHDRRKVHSRPM